MRAESLRLAAMHPNIRQALQEQGFFKLICGASYRNTDFISDLSYVFASAGAQVIDVGARPELVTAALTGIRRAQLPKDQEPLVMVSVGINQDLHFLRVEKDFDKCTDHGFCANACPHDVFVGSEIRLQNCLGCDHCVIACPEKALTLVPREAMHELHELLGACFEAGARALEIHTGTGDRLELKQLLNLIEPWHQQIQLAAFSMGAHGQAHAEIVKLAHDVVAQVGPEIIIQADGKPISGRKGAKSTQHCLDLAQALIQSELPAFIQVSGGTNDLTGKQAQTQGIGIHGVGMGSYARKYVNLNPNEPISAEDFTVAIAKAKELIRSAQL
jgi:Fe-S-cluster-containing hydrogenase component 2